MPNSRPYLLLSSENLERITEEVSDQIFQRILEDSLWGMRTIQNFTYLSKANTWKDKKLELTFWSIRIGLLYYFLFLLKKKHTFDYVFSMSGLWGHQAALDLFLQENGIDTLLFSGVNLDQVWKPLRNSVNISSYLILFLKFPIGRLVFLFSRIRLYCTATSSPEARGPQGGFENFIYYAGNVSI